MLITRTITKKVLENIVHHTFSNFGKSLQTSSLLDSLKYLGFHYATNAGISINIEDLKTPNEKKEFLTLARKKMESASRQWEQGVVSDTERYQSIIDSWNIATESLKNRIVNYYQKFDPANNLYIMAFSGARGNMSQVRQLVGMRGLMSDQEGKIIDLPIQTNFREGLSSIDYIISSYGARKGIVDTALKTADSGYLTRRLIYLAQDLVIREMDCGTKKGMIVLLDSQANTKNIIGRILIEAGKLKQSNFLENYKNLILTDDIISSLKEKKPTYLKIRSPLTCSSYGSICQNCYGWDLSQKKLISLGEAVGIIAAQSIGEPGTQLTMRTFHTGGIFTSELVQQILTPFSGKAEISRDLKTKTYRDAHGTIVSKLQQEVNIHLVSWNGIKTDISVNVGAFLYIQNETFLKKGQVIAQQSSRAIGLGIRRLKPIYTPIAGEIRFESLLIRYISRKNKSTVKVNQENGVLWLASGKVFPLPKEAIFSVSKFLDKCKSLAVLKISTPYEGFFHSENNTLFIRKKKKTIKVDFSKVKKKVKKEFLNCKAELTFLPKNYQYVDKHTIIGILNITPYFEGRIYGIRKKNSENVTTYFIITESDVWKVNLDEINNSNLLAVSKGLRSGNSLSRTSTASQSGFFLKKDGFKFIFQKARPIFLSKGAILNYKQGDFSQDQQLLATLINYTQQTEDIVQGLPKIEELIEARSPELKSYLSLRPGVFLNSSFRQIVEKSRKNGNIFSYIYDRIDLSGPYSYEKDAFLNILFKKQVIEIIHAGCSRSSIVSFRESLWKIYQIPPKYIPACHKSKYEFSFKKGDDELLIQVPGKKLSKGWCPERKPSTDPLYKYNNRHNNASFDWKKIYYTGIVYNNNKLEGYLVVELEKDIYYFFERLNPIISYKLPLSAKISSEAGTFIDIGEPLNEGTIDPHDLLANLSKYHSVFDGILLGTLRCLNKFQLIVVNSIQAIYQSQGVDISSKHIEIIVRQMTARVSIKERGDTPLLRGEVIRLSLMSEIYKSFRANKNYRAPKYEPTFLSTTSSALNKDGFLSAAGFQETKRMLTKAAIEGNSDWLRGLKECVIIGRLIPAGTTFLNYKNYLDNIYYFKKTLLKL